MAVCNHHGTGTTTCVGHRPACATNRPFTPSAGFGATGGDITSSDVDALRTKIREELTEYNLHSLYNFPLLQAGSFSVGTDVEDPHVEDLREMVGDVLNTAVTRPVGQDLITDDDIGDPSELVYQGSPIQDYTDRNGLPIEGPLDWGQGIEDLYNMLRTDCICNADCACNNVCDCHNDCGCNYSDETIKTDIVYL